MTTHYCPNCNRHTEHTTEQRGLWERFICAVCKHVQEYKTK